MSCTSHFGFVPKLGSLFRDMLGLDEVFDEHSYWDR